jgi:hypothetical protein
VPERRPDSVMMTEVDEGGSGFVDTHYLLARMLEWGVRDAGAQRRAEGIGIIGTKA